MPAKRYLPWVVAACTVLYVVKAPSQAASNIRTAADGLASAADSLSVFVNKLAS